MTVITKRFVAELCVLLLAVPVSGMAQQTPAPPAPGSQQPMKEETGLRGRITAPYRASVPPPNNLTNSTRIESLMRAGNLYLSLQDTIALALENNLDIAIQRYAPQIADTSLQIAEAGGFALNG